MLAAVATYAAKAIDARIPEMFSKVVDWEADKCAIERKLIFNPGSARRFIRKVHYSAHRTEKGSCWPSQVHVASMHGWKSSCVPRG